MVALSSFVSPRIPPIPVRVVDGADDGGLLDASLALAHTQLVGQLADETSLDARTMGTLGFIGALLAVDVAAKEMLGAAWWVPLVAIGLATVCCLSPVLGAGFGFSRDTDLGPDPAAFYATFGHSPSTAAREQLLVDLVGAFANNARRLRAKQRALRASLVILVVGFVASTVVVGTERPSTIRAADAPAQP